MRLYKVKIRNQLKKEKVKYFWNSSTGSNTSQTPLALAALGCKKEVSGEFGCPSAVLTALVIIYLGLSRDANPESFIRPNSFKIL